LAEVEEVISRDIDLRLAWRERWKVNGIDVRITGKHKLEFEPLDLLDAWFGITGRCQSVCDIRSPADDFLVLIIVEDGRNLSRVSDLTVARGTTSLNELFALFGFPRLAIP